ncbi:hypothetical protein Q31b_13810 [Novipirellula aureliae]|uniref:Uncharacterized protein n=1 Tax=Novipirellula aureliae TaxID=2527966 RepID=A0A5C6E9J2_9BACT|nr:hypothetical protein Q31b_13810 [Novipirellula aureliae]
MQGIFQIKANDDRYHLTGMGHSDVELGQLHSFAVQLRLTLANQTRDLRLL